MTKTFALRSVIWLFIVLLLSTGTSCDDSPSKLSPTTGHALQVTPDGSGDYATIAAAVLADCVADHCGGT